MSTKTEACVTRCNGLGREAHFNTTLVHRLKWLMGKKSHFWGWQHLIHWASPSLLFIVFSFPVLLHKVSSHKAHEWKLSAMHLTVRESLTAITVKLGHEVGITFSASLSVDTSRLFRAMPRLCHMHTASSDLVSLLFSAESQNWPAGTDLRTDTDVFTGLIHSFEKFL